MKRAVEEGLVLLAGAGLGLAAMYLLDPETGSHRRDAIRSAAKHTLSGVGESISGFGESIARHGNDAIAAAHDAAESAVDRAKEMLPHHEEHSIGASKIALAGGGGVALFMVGAGLAYLFDPDRGRRRRAYLRDHLNSTIHHGTRWAGKKRRHLTNRARGVYAEARSTLRPVPAE
jgi:hypothetical protein